MKKNSLFLLLSAFFLNIACADVIDQRIQYEHDMRHNPWLIAPYEPTYLLPVYYTQKPYYSFYQNNTPDNEHIDKIDLKFQFSFKVPITYHLFNPRTSLYFAYSQLSYWQAYNHSAFFSETNYAPEIFTSYFWNKNLGKDWRLKLVNFGVEHQSNGRGGVNERSWNRAYAEGTFTRDELMLSVRPWYIFNDGTMMDHNPDIRRYLGNGRVVVAYRFHRDQVISAIVQNEVESGFQRGAETLSWSFPLTKHLKGYFQVFSGYGQSLIEYNHYTNSIGAGIAASDWI